MFHLSGRATEYDPNDTIHDSSSTSKQDIQNVRLSCRTLSATASRYLIERIRVEVSSVSLSYLEKVSNHPHIRHSVRAVEICLAQYDDAVGSDLGRFVRYCKDDLMDVWGTPLGMNTRNGFVDHTWGKYLEALGDQDHDLPGRFDRQEVDCIQALLDGYRLYQCGLQEQKSFLNGGFAARVSASMANLPRARHLELTDWDAVRWGRDMTLALHSGGRLDLSSNETIVHSVAHFRSPFKKIQGNTLVHLVPNLICANITSLNIRISPRTHGYKELSLLSLRRNQLRSNLRNLRSFRFENYDWLHRSWHVDEPGFRQLAHFLDTCLESESLEHIFISPNIGDSSREESLISPRPWPKLRSAVLRDLPVSEADLNVLTRSIASQQEGSLSLRSVNLYCGGTWASVLDMLRDKRIRVRLDWQSGAEFKTNPDLAEDAFHHKSVTTVRLHRHSGDAWEEEMPTRFFPSFAEFYVQGEDMPNPILSPPDTELRNRLLSDGDRDDQLPSGE